MIGDWIAGTIKLKKKTLIHVLSEVQNYFAGYGMTWLELEHGYNGYSKAAKVGSSCKVLWRPDRLDMGVHVVIPASGIAEMGVSFEAICRDLHYVGLVASRFDFAADDFDGLLDMDVIRAKADGKKEVVSRAKHVRELRDLAGGSGETIYFGDRESEMFVRVYDKRQERLDKGEKCEREHWIRVEPELKGARAHAAFLYVVTHPEGWHEAACGWLRSHLDFKEPGEDEQKSRWETSSWWLAFLANAAKLRLAIGEQVKTVERVRRWVKKQVTPSLLVLGKTIGYEELFSDILEAASRLSIEQEHMIDCWQPVT